MFKMKKDLIEGSENQLSGNGVSEKHPSHWLYALKGVFSGIGILIRPSMEFLYRRKRVKPDGSETETIVSYKVD